MLRPTLGTGARHWKNLPADGVGVDTPAPPTSAHYGSAAKHALPACAISASWYRWPPGHFLSPRQLTHGLTTDAHRFSTAASHDLVLCAGAGPHLPLLAGRLGRSPSQFQAFITTNYNTVHGSTLTCRDKYAAASSIIGGTAGTHPKQLSLAATNTRAVPLPHFGVPHLRFPHCPFHCRLLPTGTHPLLYYSRWQFHYLLPLHTFYGSIVNGPLPSFNAFPPFTDTAFARTFMPAYMLCQVFC